MNIFPVTGIRSVAIGVPDLETAARFYAEVWGLAVVDRSPDAVYLRATGPAHHVLALHRSPEACIRSVDLHAASVDVLADVADRVGTHGGVVLHGPAPLDEPGGGIGLALRDPQGRTLRIIADDRRYADCDPAPNRPTKITHVVLNSEDVAVAQRFLEQVLGFVMSDRTRIMAFMRCSDDHHSAALADSQVNTLNHIAFLMPDLESVMRGAGRMIDAGYPIEWGVGRHGPGNNVFAYFVGPGQFVIEYTAEVGKVDERYRVGGPDDWRWPPGRIDQWGIGVAPTDRLRAAQRAIRFAT